MFKFTYFFTFFFLSTLTTALYGPSDAEGNGTFPILVDSEGTVVAGVHVDIQLEQIEELMRNDVNKREDALEEILNLDISSLNLDFQFRNVTNEGSAELEKRLDIHACSTWVKGAVQCVNDVWEGLNAVWDIAFKIKQLTSSKQCTEIHGRQGGLYYRFWSAGGDCDTTAEQKTIAGAIHAVIKKLDGEWQCNIYCITMTHGGTWKGTLLIGPSYDAQFADCSGQFKGCYDAGCGALEGWYSCKS